MCLGQASSQDLQRWSPHVTTQSTAQPAPFVPRAQPLDRIILGSSCYGFRCQWCCLQILLPRAWHFLCVSESEGWAVIRPNEVEKAAAVSLVAQEVRHYPFFPEWGVPDRRADKRVELVTLHRSLTSPGYMSPSFQHETTARTSPLNRPASTMFPLYPSSI